MPITDSAKKALRSSAKKKVFNIRRQKALDSAVKEVKKLVKAGDSKDVATALSKAYKALDKAAKNNTISKNTASRKKSRLSKLVKKGGKK